MLKQVENFFVNIHYYNKLSQWCLGIILTALLMCELFESNSYSLLIWQCSVIIGAGPAGFMAAAWMAHLGISARIVDKRSDKVQRGQADGIHARTMEIFDSFGFADRVLKESNPLVETYFWVRFTPVVITLMQSS